jgi:hypothetical protein
MSEDKMAERAPKRWVCPTCGWAIGSSLPMTVDEARERFEPDVRRHKQVGCRSQRSVDGVGGRKRGGKVRGWNKAARVKRERERLASPAPSKEDAEDAEDARRQAAERIKEGPPRR